MVPTLSWAQPESVSGFIDPVLSQTTGQLIQIAVHVVDANGTAGDGNVTFRYIDQPQ